ncbi:MAG: response regulator [Dehalococcoidales bacterium]|nr:response regulator [Dehalococcoidales bacterium]
MREEMPAKETILIVDDEEAIRKLLGRKLVSMGYRCREAGGAAQAMDELQDGAVALVLLDIKMPGKSGVQLLPEIRAAYPDTVVIMATATTDTDTAVHCMKHGAYDYVTKPFNLSGVVLSVERALERKRLELENRYYQQHLEERVSLQAEKIRRSFLNSITALAYALEAKDRYTSGHSEWVAALSVVIATELGLPSEEIEKIRLAGLLHDIGKIGVKEPVLNKPERLTDDEFQYVKSHCELGERILAPIVEDKDILFMVRHHHERYDGAGYPDGLPLTEMPPSAGILAAKGCPEMVHEGVGGGVPSWCRGASVLAVADSFDAMTSARSYRKAMSDEMACAEIEKGRGTQFTPAVVDAFLRVKKKIPVAD